jgi:hypothetical protein
MEYIVTVKCTTFDETELQDFQVTAADKDEAIDKAMDLARENGSEECEYEYDSIREA